MQTEVTAAVLLVAALATLQGILNVCLLLYSGRSPTADRGGGPPGDLAAPRASVSVLVPVCEGQSVRKETLRQLLTTRYPPHLVEVIVVGERRDAATIARVAAAIDELEATNLRLVLIDDGAGPVTRPHCLNAGLREARHDLVVVHDAEAGSHPELFDVVNTVFEAEHPDAAQCGVQPAGRSRGWHTPLHMLEHYFWHRAARHWFARVGLFPPSPSPLFVRRELLVRAGGWDEASLVEDADLGLRLSLVGAKVRALDDARGAIAVRPPADLATLVDQRTRRYQGLLEVFARGEWRLLPAIGHRARAAYALLLPQVQAIHTALLALAAYALLRWELAAPVQLALSLPVALLALHLAIHLASAARVLRPSGAARQPSAVLLLAVSYLAYQWVLGYCALRAAVRHLLGLRTWTNPGRGRTGQTVLPSAVADGILRAIARPREVLIAVGLLFALYAVVSWVTLNVLNVVWTDAASRTYAALTVLFDTGAPKLAYLGFVWLPLPTVAQLPLLALPWLAERGFAGPVSTALAGAAGVAIMLQLLTRFGLPPRERWLLAALYAVNPVIVLFSANGMSEIVAVALLLAQLYTLTCWAQGHRMVHLIAYAMVTAAAAMVRFESWPLLIASGLAIAIVLPGVQPGWRPRLQPTMLVTLVPAVYLIVAFVLWRWIILGSLGLGGGEYSQGAYVPGGSVPAQVGPNQNSYSAYVIWSGGSLAIAANYTLQTVWSLFPLFIPAVVAAMALSLWSRDRLLLALTVLATALPVENAVLVWLGYSLGWVRFFIYVIPLATVLLAYLLARRPWRAWAPAWARHTALGCVVAGLLASHGSGLFTIASGRMGLETEPYAVRAWLTGQSSNQTAATDTIVSYLRSHLEGRRILIDDFTGARIILYHGQPDAFIQTRDLVFKDAVKDPPRFADYLLVPEPLFVAQLDAFNRRYPDLYYQGTPFATLEAEFVGPPVDTLSPTIELGNPLRGGALLTIHWNASSEWNPSGGEFRQRWRLFRLSTPAGSVAHAGEAP
ncbi:MAG: glycosyltransferase [Chloroflexi bacterium]|nr:glycosyltransferase [Chloroflexota bacterium]